MTKYIALLRGINISGKNKVSMPLLKAAFEEIGFTEVSTYINSGNVIFTSNNTDIMDLINICQSIIKDQFLLDIPVTIISANDLAEAINNAPKWWDQTSDKSIINQAIFLIPPTTIDEVYKAVGEAKSEYEQVGFYKNVIFWSAPRSTISKTRWYKISSSSVNNRVTIRNARTTKKLLTLVSE